MNKNYTMHIRYRDGYAQRLMIDHDDLAKLLEIERGKKFIVFDKEDIGKLIMINCNEIQSLVISYGQEQENVDECTTK